MQAQGELHGSLDVTYQSKYMWRGIDVYGDKSGIQPTVMLDLYGTGFGVSVQGHRANASGFETTERWDTTLFYKNAAFMDESYAMQVTISDNVIEFPRKFAEHEMDVELTEKLMAELSGIFNWALEGYKRLGCQKFIFSESTAMFKSKKQYQQQSNSVLDFIENCLKDADPDDSSPFKNLYDCYQGFCEIEGNKRCFPKKEFRSILENEGIKIENSSKHSNQLRVSGVKYEAVYE